MLIKTIFSYFDFIKKLPTRTRMIFKLVYGKKLSKTYYPDEERKSKHEMFIDNLTWMLKKNEVNHHYYLYGFDRKNINNTDNYIGRKEYLNQLTKKKKSFSIDGQKLNYKCLVHDKLVFSRYAAGLGFSTPKCIAIIKNNNITWLETAECLEIESILNKNLDVFCKPLLGFGGKGAFSFQVKNGRLFIDKTEQSIKVLRNRLSVHHILEERIVQHSALAQLHKQSVNSIRLFTTLSHGQPTPLFAKLRIGNKGSEVDTGGGGIFIGIDLETGTLHKYGFLMPPGGRLMEHPVTGIKFDGFKIPYFDDALELGVRLHRFAYGLHTIGWDIAITDKGPCVFEANDEPELATNQAIFGGLRNAYLATLDNN